ncbi:hypothetical protein Anas_14192 [Armadillidium nasatum]|uniref:Chitin-binding type-2 domain-containing protein n=1 Tax=Armadillidium nasatum TaxID=96803 RepID=A0A5N5T4M1_9CRUS|nr:hypothetical protein Anas_14192 [Armadillidium nasatum]
MGIRIFIYFICSGNDLIPLNCTGTLCFDQAACACVENGGSSSTTTSSSSSSSSSTITTTNTATTMLTCPSDCPFVNDPSSCQSYFFCSGNELISYSCFATLCFDQESCACVEVVTQTYQYSELDISHQLAV